MQKEKQWSTQHTLKTTDRVTRTPQKNRGWTHVLRKGSSSCPTSGAIAPSLHDYLLWWIIQTNVVCISNRYSGMHSWLMTHYFTVCTSNGKSFGGKRGGEILWVNMMYNVIVGMVTPPVTIAVFFQYIIATVVTCSNQLHYVILLFTLTSGRYLVSHKTPITYVTNLFVFLIAKVDGKWNIITRLKTVYFSSGKRHAYDLQPIIILSSLKGYRKQSKTQIKQNTKTQNDITIRAIIFRFSMRHPIVLYRNWWDRIRYVTKTKTKLVSGSLFSKIKDALT